MKCTDIQIDDYVMFDGSIYQVEEISKDGWVHMTHSNGMRVRMSSDYIIGLLEGVLITPEILLKNNFSLIEETSKFYRWEYADGIYINIDFKVDEPFVAIHNRCYYAVPVCNYVHQLQHAIRLCNIDKQIIL